MRNAPHESHSVLMLDFVSRCRVLTLQPEGILDPVPIDLQVQEVDVCSNRGTWDPNTATCACLPESSTDPTPCALGNFRPCCGACPARAVGQNCDTVLYKFATALACYLDFRSHP